MTLFRQERNEDWIACIDFGTAMSKMAMVRSKARNDLTGDDIRPLPIAERDGYQPLNPYLLSSVVFIGKDQVSFGQEAEELAIRLEPRGRRAFSSPKQYLSTHADEDFDGGLDPETDPTREYTPRQLLQLFLAHLLERGGAGARQEGLPWPVRLRTARPAWKPARAARGEAALKNLVLGGFWLVGRLGGLLSASGGLDHSLAQSELQQIPAFTDADVERVFRLSADGKGSVLEATAVATGSIRDSGRRVVAVADIGGGTSDFGAFMTGLRGRQVLAEVVDESIGDEDRVLREGGDYLDKLLREFICTRFKVSRDDSATRGDYNRLLVRARSNKENLFAAEDGKLAIQIGEEPELITREEFLEQDSVQAFAQRLRGKFDKVLKLAVQAARNHPGTSGARTPVEILLTGGGSRLPMVERLRTTPSIDWTYLPAAIDLGSKPEDLNFTSVRRQLAVAIGGAIRDLPTTTAPLRMDN